MEMWSAVELAWEIKHETCQRYPVCLNPGLTGTALAGRLAIDVKNALKAVCAALSCAYPADAGHISGTFTTNEVF